MAQFRFVHNNINVVDLEASLDFYQKVLGLRELRRKEREGFTIAFLGDGQGSHQLELTWLKDWPKGKYDLGDNEFHLAFETDDYEAAHALHEEMGCICYENPGMGLYFIADPDGYWLEIIPRRWAQNLLRADEKYFQPPAFLFEACFFLCGECINEDEKLQPTD